MRNVTFYTLNFTFENFNQEGKKFLKDLTYCIKNMNNEYLSFDGRYHDIKAKIRMRNGGIYINDTYFDIDDLRVFISDVAVFIDFMEWLQEEDDLNAD